MTDEDVTKVAEGLVALLNLGDGTAKIPNTSRAIVAARLRSLLARDRREMAGELTESDQPNALGIAAWLLSKAKEIAHD